MADNCKNCEYYYYERDPDILTDYCKLKRFRFEGDYSICSSYKPKSPGSSGSGCYLTTACTVARNLPDNCEELQTLRAFRDGYLKSTEEGQKDIQEYYGKAPKLVEIINGRSDKEQIYDRIYSELILPCVAFIKNMKNEEAHRLYRDYTLSLYEMYAI